MYIYIYIYNWSKTVRFLAFRATLFYVLRWLILQISTFYLLNESILFIISCVSEQKVGLSFYNTERSLHLG